MPVLLVFADNDSVYKFVSAPELASIIDKYLADPFTKAK